LEASGANLPLAACFEPKQCEARCGPRKIDRGLHLGFVAVTGQVADTRATLEQLNCIALA
jgi:hypothetical protein